jgi:hypothetical protein
LSYFVSPPSSFFPLSLAFSDRLDDDRILGSNVDRRTTPRPIQFDFSKPQSITLGTRLCRTNFQRVDTTLRAYTRPQKKLIRNFIFRRKEEAQHPLFCFKNSKAHKADGYFPDGRRPAQGTRSSHSSLARSFFDSFTPFLALCRLLERISRLRDERRKALAPGWYYSRGCDRGEDCVNASYAFARGGRWWCHHELKGEADEGRSGGRNEKGSELLFEVFGPGAGEAASSYPQ